MNPPPSEPPAAAPEDDVALARRVREQALAVEGVAALGRGRSVEAATYWVDSKILGVAVRPDTLEVHIVARYPEGFPLTALSGRMRERLSPLAGGRLIDIVVDDVVFEEEGGVAGSEEGGTGRPGSEGHPG